MLKTTNHLPMTRFLQHKILPLFKFSIRLQAAKIIYIWHTSYIRACSTSGNQNENIKKKCQITHFLELNELVYYFVTRATSKKFLNTETTVV